MILPEKAIPGDLLLTPSDTAQALGVRYGTLTVWRQRRIGPSWLVMPGRRIYYRASEIARFLDALEQRTARMPLPRPGRMPGGKNRPKPDIAGATPQKA